MSKWNEIKNNIVLFADKAAKKTEELTDIAAVKLSIVGKESTRDNEYKKLGKCVYEKLKAEDTESTSILTDQIAESIKKIDTLTAEIEELENELKSTTSNNENSKKKLNFNAKPKKSSDPEIMKQFEQARVVANQKYEEALLASEQAMLASEQATLASGQAKLVSEKAARLAAEKNSDTQ